MHSTTLGWRMVNPEMPDQWTISLGECAEKLADIYSIRREAAGRVRGREPRQRRRAPGTRASTTAGSSRSRPSSPSDEGIRPDTSLEKLAKLKPAFRKPDGTVTAGNATPAQRRRLRAADRLAGGRQRAGREPLARIAGRGTFAVDPDVFGIAPVQAANRALARAGIGWGDLKQVELNEAFASQSLACLADWKELDPELLNAYGGAIALGHPLGASGARILGTLAHGLKQRGGGYGLAAICIGVGQGLAMVVEA